MARPKGYPLNVDAFEDWMTVHLGETITSIAEKAGMTRGALSGLVGRHHNASVPTAHKLADAMGCSVGTLFPTLGRRRGDFTDDLSPEAA